MDLVVDIERVSEFDLLKEEVKEFAQQGKSSDSENNRLEDLVETLKDPIDVCEFIIALLSLLNAYEKMKLSQWFQVRKQRKYLKVTGRWSRSLANARSPSYLKQKTFDIVDRYNQITYSVFH